MPINICPAVKVVVPIPPLETVNVPDDIFEAFKDVIFAPDPVKLVAVILVADIVVPVNTPVNVPPVKGKKLLNVLDNDTPERYNSPAFKFKLPPTSSGYYPGNLG